MGISKCLHGTPDFIADWNKKCQGPTQFFFFEFIKNNPKTLLT